MPEGNATVNNPSANTPLTREQAFALVDAVSANEGLALSASAFEDENGEWVFEATCSEQPDLDKFSQLAVATLGGNVKFSAEKIDPDIDWVARSLEGLPPVAAGCFFIHAGHNKNELPPGLTPIHIEAGEAFGTGHHETTTGCLLAIYQTLRKKTPRRSIDVGTGSGVLAIALAKQLKRKIIASDIDPKAVRTARANVRLNKVKKLVKVVEAAGLDSAKIRARGPYDLIVANILAGPLAGLAPAISANVNKGASVILSGILNEQAPQVIKAYGARNFTLVQRIILKQWTTLILEKD